MEVQIHHLADAVNELKTELHKTNEKLDELLVLRNKGAGLFWLASVIFGTGIAGALASMMGYVGVR